MSDTIQVAGEAPDGIVILPQRAPFWAVCGPALAFGGQVFWAGTYTAGLNSKIAGLTESDLRLAERLASLERDRDRLPMLEERFDRIEEKMTIMIELLRETRQEREGPPKRGG
ncbi:hypothetical protein [Methylorubrum extorquens]|uniref:hypothetical protein n=1 Tax=Methylorubrum extorquens TaxID=408 RepID=UPI001EE636A6|nr:hypothetical protein [Methylorubrum extorquens]MCG5245129.1 hypothetical protein [Methylorubrum extorquens]